MLEDSKSKRVVICIHEMRNVKAIVITMSN
jgi:hypothetical protein